ncbi:MAG: DUF3833 family protein [Aestuariivita sp.]|nr:DUF3833 family protein [Aestuariivita sp.]MCY4203592.1 DUF3833 family protein [Aestuariivita sp.]MCY4288928.1 DUF3833 family protein [Aestuariivita sp.]MCY4346169.1 DUF3833 family protein [Aestuariivita sp.]
MSILFGVLIGAGSVMLLCVVRHFVASFAAQKSEHYDSGQPIFDIQTQLNGPILCEGVIFGPLGRVSGRFVGNFDINWDGTVGIMKEHFRYDDGSELSREWQLHVEDGGRVRATAADIIGTAIGQQSGPTLKMKYRIKLEAAGTPVLSAIDWMYLLPNGTIINRSQFRKFGIKVAELVATMKPLTLQQKGDE